MKTLINRLFNDKDYSIKLDGSYSHCELMLEQLKDGELSLYISEIWSDVKNKGYATKLLKRILKYSDKNNIPITLRASINNTIKTSEGLNQADLINWYVKHGFRVSEEDNNFETDKTAPFMIYNY